ncbi:hypothetical protein SOASR030_02300 [Leminorella grimontii]|uniref:Phage tail protein C-terminal domain-containing protein n=1 Tax=Leminorella grimontii TaxID=82981 RepID=A0AAV5MWA0_9GAMM|nr:hypothetical protein [Leminorella grimontii]KFC95698.1 phage tail fiber protein [Leminorella grimontii ATCC 33999 = DSM 5078]GKX54118.1 hypothetical protein SOASR030_02300 [Leminorella grimontii]VFS60014.1 Uncharacterised protein [Leminorella grimontii]
MSAGTITLTNNSDLVVGTGTAFTSDLAAGDIIVAVVGGVTYTLPVKSIESDISATLIKVYDGPTQAGSAWTAVPRDTLSAITAQLGAEAARALRGLNYDKQNWQQVFSEARDITVTLPDGSTFDGPSWLKVVELLREIDLDTITAIAQSVNADAQQVSTDKDVVVAAKESANTSAASAESSKNAAAESSTAASSSASNAAESETNAASSAASAKADADRAAAANPDKALLKENNLSDLASVSGALENLGLSEVAIKVSGSVPITQGGTGATTASEALDNLGGAPTNNPNFTTGASIDGTPILKQGDFGVGNTNNPYIADIFDKTLASGIYKMNATTSGGPGSYGLCIRMSDRDFGPGGSTGAENQAFSALIVRPDAIQFLSYADGSDITWITNWNTVNTTVDSNGFIKRASPIVKLFGDGGSEPNNEAKGVTSERISEGVYRLTGAIMGFCSDSAWHIEVPTDENKQPLIWVDYEIEPTGDVIVKTYHRTHPTAPAFARNERDGYDDGESIDIPAGRWVDLRVQVYSTEMAS